MKVIYTDDFLKTFSEEEVKSLVSLGEIKKTEDDVVYLVINFEEEEIQVKLDIKK